MRRPLAAGALRVSNDHWVTPLADHRALAVRAATGPMVATIEREGIARPPEPLTAQRLGEGLQSAALWVHDSVEYWAEMLDKWKLRPNEFVAYG